MSGDKVIIKPVYGGLDAIQDFQVCTTGISRDFKTVLLHIFLNLPCKNQLVTRDVEVLANTIGLPME